MKKDDDFTCLENGYHLIDLQAQLKNSDQIYAVCADLFPSDVTMRQKCMIKAQVNDLPSSSQSAIEKQVEQLKVVDKTIKSITLCLKECNSNEQCEQSCFTNVREAFGEEISEAAYMKMKCQTLTNQADQTNLKAFCNELYIEQTSLLMSLIQLEEYTKAFFEITFEVDLTYWENFQDCAMDCMHNQNLTTED